MTIATIELNDTGIRLSVAGKIISTTPGYAVITSDALLLGEVAQQQARIHPLQTNNQFWRHLSLDPLNIDNTQVRHHADLAYSQLSDLHQRSDFDEVVFAVPGHFGNEQLSLLLGIAQECPFNTVALVDSAVAAVAPFAPSGRYLHLDTQLHQSVATLVQVDGEVSRQSVEVFPGVGLLTYYDRWAKLVSDNFIRQTRFDPFHDAAIEQQLYNQLPIWIAQIQNNGDAKLQLEDKSITLPLTAWVGQVQALYNQIDQVLQRLAPNVDGIFLSDLSATLPGLSQIWPQAHRLPPDAVATSCHTHRRLLYGATDSLSFTTRLPASPNPAIMPSAPVSSRGAATAATHVLWHYQAYPLRAGRLFIETPITEKQRRELSGEPVFTRQLTNASLCAIETASNGTRLRLFQDGSVLVNGRPATEGALLKAGDELKIDQCRDELKLISVLDTL